MAIKDWPAEERPRERLRRFGAAALSDAELLAIFLRVGIRGASAVDLARTLLQRFGGNIAQLAAASSDELAALPGIGPAKAAQLAATLELARRSLRARLGERDVLTSPQLVRDWLRLQLADLGHEVFGVVCLDAQHRLIGYEELFRGTLTQTSVYPREVVKHVLRCNAAAVILTHNHPSGVAEPSGADRSITTALQQALALVDVKLLDHFIIAGDTALSLAERGFL